MCIVIPNINNSSKSAGSRTELTDRQPNEQNEQRRRCSSITFDPPPYMFPLPLSQPQLNPHRSNNNTNCLFFFSTYRQLIHFSVRSRWSATDDDTPHQIDPSDAQPVRARVCALVYLLRLRKDIQDPFGGVFWYSSRIGPLIDSQASRARAVMPR